MEKPHFRVRPIGTGWMFVAMNGIKIGPFYMGYNGINGYACEEFIEANPSLK